MTDRPKTIPPELATKIRDELQSLEGTVMALGLEYAAAFAVFSAIQRAAKDPMLHGVDRQIAVEFAGRIESWLGGPDRPNLAKLLRDGWKTELLEVLGGLPN